MSFKIGLTGTPGSGKSTLSRLLAGSIRKYTSIKTIELVSEYARPYINKYGIENISDQLLIYLKQLADEEEYPSSTELIISDSPVFLSFPYAVAVMRQGNLRDAKILSEIFQMMIKLNVNPRYDIIFHLPPIVEPVKDGVREEYQFNPEWRNSFDSDIQSTFRIFKPKHFIVLNSIDVESRVKESLEHINRLLKPPTKCLMKLDNKKL